MDYEELFKRMLGTTNGIIELLNDIDNDYIEAMFFNESLTYEIIVDFIDKYKSEIIHSALNDELLIDGLLCKKMVIDRTKRNTIDEQYFDGLISKIKNKEFNHESLIFFLDIVQFHNLYASIFDEDTIKNIYKTGIFSTIKNEKLISEDGDTIISVNKKIEMTNVFLSWDKKCGKTIMPYIFQLENLKKNVTILLNSEKANKYQQELNDLLKLCDYSIQVRDSDTIPNNEEIKQINSIFERYDYINKSILLDTLVAEELLLVHFVRDNDVNYQLIGNDIIDTNADNNNTFDDEQSHFFIESYIEYIIPLIEEKTGKKVDFNDPTIRKIITQYLEQYNNSINNRPLDRLPIKKKEMYRFKYYIRQSDSRLSCSIISKDNPMTHLDRKIGLILRTKMTDAILSTSFGYTSEKAFRDFRNDSVPCTKLFELIDNPEIVNETCVDSSECDVIGVVVLSNEEQVIERAQRIATSYNVGIMNLNDEKHY